MTNRGSKVLQAIVSLGSGSTAVNRPTLAPRRFSAMGWPTRSMFVGASLMFKMSIRTGASENAPDASVARTKTCRSPTSKFPGVPLNTPVTGLNRNHDGRGTPGAV